MSRMDRAGMKAMQLAKSPLPEQEFSRSDIPADLAALGKELSALTAAKENETFAELALSLFCFTERLHDRLLESGAREVFFLAREGQLMKRLFDRYQARRFQTGAPHIRSHYLEVSRRSTFLPSLGPLASESFETLFRQYRRISGEEFLLNLGLEALMPQLESTMRAHDFRMRQEDFPTSALFADLLTNAIFRSKYEAARLDRRAAFFSYLDTFERQGQADVLHLVDVGWKGTIQDNLCRLFRQAESEGARAAPRIEGMYLGLVASGAAGPGNPKHGVLFSALDGGTPHHRIFNENRALFEVMLAADHGSAASYHMLPDGRGAPVQGTFAEEALFRSLIAPAQRRLLDRFESIDALLCGKSYEASWLLRVAARHHARMVFQATPHEIEWFGGVYHVENFGVFENSHFVGREQRGFFARCAFAWDVIVNRRRTELGFWPWLSIRRRSFSGLAYAYRLLRCGRLA